MKTRKFKPKFEKKMNGENGDVGITKKTKKDHFRYDIHFNNKKVGIFQITHSSREYGKRLMSNMATQLGISVNQLVGIEKCTFYAKDFKNHSRLLKN